MQLSLGSRGARHCWHALLHGRGERYPRRRCEPGRYGGGAVLRDSDAADIRPGGSGRARGSNGVTLAAVRFPGKMIEIGGRQSERGRATNSLGGRPWVAARRETAPRADLGRMNNRCDLAVVRQRRRQSSAIQVGMAGKLGRRRRPCERKPPSIKAVSRSRGGGTGTRTAGGSRSCRVFVDVRLRAAEGKGVALGPETVSTGRVGLGRAGSLARYKRRPGSAVGRHVGGRRGMTVCYSTHRSSWWTGEDWRKRG